MLSPRFPFPSFPAGWFVIAFSDDVGPGTVETVRYFGQEIVLFRTESGTPTAVEPRCPHLGAHLGGGCVRGESLECPFHAWRFGPDGRCVEVPYAPKIPPLGVVRTWPLREQGGLIFAWYDPDGKAPAWELPPLEEEGWTANRRVRWELDSHPQEVGENVVDSAHLGPVHHVDHAEVLELEPRGHTLRSFIKLVATGEAVGMPEQINDVRLDVTLHGLGQIISLTEVLNEGLLTRQRIHPTPIDEDRLAIFAVTNAKVLPDPDFTAEVASIFHQAFLVDFPRDFPIWGRKFYNERPVLAGGDGPIPAYRKWCRQFYRAPDQSRAGAGTRARDPRRGTRQREVGDDRNGSARWRRLWHSGWSRVQAAAAGAGAQILPRLPRWVRAPGGVATAPQAVATPAATPGPTTTPDPTPAQPRTIPTIQAYFDSLPERFDAAAARGLDAVFQWEISGADGGTHHAVVRDGSIELAAGPHPEPTVSIQIPAEDYLQIVNRETNETKAFIAGRGKVSGNVRLAMRMRKLFPLN